MNRFRGTPAKLAKLLFSRHPHVAEVAPLVCQRRRRRWDEAQRAELANWREAGKDTVRLLYELSEHSAAAPLLRNISVERAKKWRRALEIGIGPLGIGFVAVHLYDLVEGAVVGVDSLPRLDIGTGDEALDRYGRTLQGRVAFFRMDGAHTGFQDEVFDLVACINVIDHAAEPVAILEEAARLLEAGGQLLLGVNTFSAVGRARFEFRGMLRPQEPGFLMHPHSFTLDGARRLLQDQGWRRVEVLNPGSWRSRLLGAARMSFFLCTKGSGSTMEARGNGSHSCEVGLTPARPQKA